MNLPARIAPFGPAPRPIEIAVPAFGDVAEVRPGLLWVRLPLPMKVGHVNVYLLRDGEGWAIVDAGYGDARTIATWEALLHGPLAGERMTRLIVTHAHIDHVGAAGWLCARLGIPLLMSQVEYLTCRLDLADAGAYLRAPYQQFLCEQGIDTETASAIGKHLGRYGKGLTGLPDTFDATGAGDILQVGERRLKTLVGSGHAQAQLLLYCQAERWLISADQVINGIHPLLILPPTEPNGSPLAQLMESSRRIASEVDPATLVLAGHFPPFHGLEEAVAAQLAHHRSRCEMLRQASQTVPRTPLELARLLFPTPLNARQINHAICEVIPYANWLVEQGLASWIGPNPSGVRKLLSH